MPDGKHLIYMQGREAILALTTERTQQLAHLNPRRCERQIYPARDGYARRVVRYIGCLSKVEVIVDGVER
jgi:hypothetical protein